MGWVGRYGLDGLDGLDGLENRRVYGGSIIYLRLQKNHVPHPSLGGSGLVYNRSRYLSYSSDAYLFMRCDVVIPMSPPSVDVV